jgi:hypothetical protein
MAALLARSLGPSALPDLLARPLGPRPLPLKATARRARRNVSRGLKQAEDTLMRSLTIGVAMFVLLSPGGASAAPRTKTAEQLGNLIGSETACALSFDKNAIRAFIEKNVPADDLDFARNLETYIFLAETHAKNMGSTEQVARCFQIKRSAEALGLLAK